MSTDLDEGRACFPASMEGPSEGRQKAREEMENHETGSINFMDLDAFPESRLLDEDNHEDKIQILILHIVFNALSLRFSLQYFLE